MLSIDRSYMDKQLNARISPDIYNRIKTVKSDSKLTMNTLVEQLLEIGLDAYLKGNVATDSNSYVSQSDFDSFRGEMLGKLSSLVEQLKQVESIDALKAENKAIKTENHPETLDKPLKVAKIARTGGKVETPITYAINSDGSLIVRSIRGCRSSTLKTLSDDELVSIGVVRRGDKFYPL